MKCPWWRYGNKRYRPFQDVPYNICMKLPLLVSTPVNITHLTGLATNPLEQDFWVLLTQKRVYLFTDARYSDVLTALKGGRQQSRLGMNIEPVEITAARPLGACIQAIMHQNATSRLYFEAEHLAVAQAKILQKKLEARLLPTVGVVAAMRMVKQQDEVASITRACAAIEACIKDIECFIRPGITEREIAFKLETWLREKGHESAFSPIVAINEHSAIPHYNTQTNGKKRVGKNCIVLIDAGAKVKNYCADITRMYTAKNAPAGFLQRYDTVRAIQKMTIQQLARYKTYRAVDIFCRRNLEKAGIAPHSHATGHGIGLEVHEGPRINLTAKDCIATGHVVTIEPGTYIEGKYGIRIEDTVYIDTNGQPRVLTKSSTALRVINI